MGEVWTGLVHVVAPTAQGLSIHLLVVIAGSIHAVLLVIGLGALRVTNGTHHGEGYGGSGDRGRMGALLVVGGALIIGPGALSGSQRCSCHRARHSSGRQQ